MLKRSGQHFVQLSASMLVLDAGTIYVNPDLAVCEGTFNLLKLKLDANVRNDNIKRKQFQRWSQTRPNQMHSRRSRELLLPQQHLFSLQDYMRTMADRQQFSSTHLINKLDDSACSSTDEVLSELDSGASEPYPDAVVSVEEPTLEEVVRAIKILRNGHAAGPDIIPRELLRYAIGPITSDLHSMFTEV